MKKITLSVVLATRNEENNLDACLASVRDIADEIIVYDEYSDDNTVQIAKKYNAKIFRYQHKRNFHETKQKAIDKAKGDWVLQLDADERVSRELCMEILSVVKGSHDSFVKNDIKLKDFQRKNRLFKKHQKLISKRDESLGKISGEIAAYFIPRLNYFLGKSLQYAGVYPDGVIRFFKRGKARLPGKSVHELMEVDGRVGWLYSDLVHLESPTFARYLERANRYTDITAAGFMTTYKNKSSIVQLLYYSFVKPFIVFAKIYFIHKGFLDGVRGFVWCLYSALHYPIAYFKYYQSATKT